MPFRVDERAGRIQVNRAIFAAQFEEHQFGAVVQLHAEPVPANLIRAELFGEPFVVHPGAASHGRRVHGTGYLEEREGHIVRRVPAALGFLTEAVLAFDDERLFGFEAQMKAEVFGCGIQSSAFRPTTRPTSFRSRRAKNRSSRRRYRDRADSDVPHSGSASRRDPCARHGRGTDHERPRRLLRRRPYVDPDGRRPARSHTVYPPHRTHCRCNTTIRCESLRVRSDRGETGRGSQGRPGASPHRLREPEGCTRQELP